MNAVMPTLDPAVHAIVELANTDKAVYAPGAVGRVLVTLHNRTSSDFLARVAASIYRDASLVTETSVDIRVRGASIGLAELPFTTPNSGERGYRVFVTIKDEHGAIRDTTATAIDVQVAQLHRRFPRPCWVSHWDGVTDARSLIASQIAWHCNTVQSYASYYRPELAPPASMRSWQSLSNLTVNRVAIKHVIAAAHAANMPVGFFQAVGEAYANWPSQPVRPSLAWGSFRNRCGLYQTCTAADMDRSPPAPNDWNAYRWQADHLDFFDPCNKNWQDFLLAKSIGPMFEQFGFDFWQADTVGAPAQPTFDAKGAPIDTDRCLTELVATAQARLRRPVILNTTSGWGLTDAISNDRQFYLYRETWNFDTPYYPGLNGVVAAVTRSAIKGPASAIVQPAYINRDLARKCALRSRIAGCFVNPHSARLATAMFAIAGSTWMNHADAGCILTNVFVEGHHLPCSSMLIDALLAYKAFEVAYEQLLRDGARDSKQECAIVSGGKESVVGAAGKVYLLSKVRPGSQICHLLNLTGVSSNDWTDLSGSKERPTPLGPLTLKIHYSGDPVAYGRNRLWFASPDRLAGAAQTLSYTAGSDGDGNYVAFSLPALRYWSMIVLETA